MKDKRQSFIERHKGFFWSTPEESRSSISDDLLVEATLNYGTLDDYMELKDILTPRRLAKVFFSATGRKADNYFPEIRNLFSLALAKYA